MISPVHGQRRIAFELGDPKVYELNGSVGTDKDVRRLKVPVNYVVTMCGCNSIQDLIENVTLLSTAQCRIDEVIERAGLKVLKQDKKRARIPLLQSNYWNDPR